MYGGEHVFKHSLAGPLLLGFFLFVLHKDAQRKRRVTQWGAFFENEKEKWSCRGKQQQKKGKEMQAGGIRINLPGLLCKGK